jgi:choline-sulfatase
VTASGLLAGRVGARSLPSPAARIAPATTPASRPSRLPNILLIMSDEHDPAVTGCYGDKIVQTPHLDRLASQGVTFDAAYCNSPLCVPSRLSFIAGKYVSRVSAWGNPTWLPSADYPTLASVLSGAGYDCLLGGKMHFDATRRYGFTELFPSRYNREHKTGKGNRRDADSTKHAAAAWQNRAKDFRVGDESPILQADPEVTACCGEFLRNRQPTDKPFFLTAGYIAPHFPLVVPEAYARRYRGKVPMPKIPDGFLDSLPTNYKQLRYGFGNTIATPEETLRGRELYWGLVNWFDDQVGRLLAALDDSQVADNTIVIYTSDHGENKGDHGLWWKNCMYEQAARVPLIVRWPKRWTGGQRRSGVCSLLDVAQTIARIAGTLTPADWDGDSLLPYLDDPKAPWKDCAVSEYYGHNIASGFAMLRQGPWKYVYHTRMDETHGPERELYNLQEDPDEFHNLAGQAAQKDRVATMHRALIQELREHPDVTEQRCRTEQAKGYGRGPRPADLQPAE